MTSQVTGLRPVQSNVVRNKYDRNQRPIVGERQRETELRPVATPVSRYAAPPSIPQDRRLEQLAQALSKLAPALNRYGEADKDRKAQEQAARLPAFVEQYKRDHGSGRVTAAQVGEVFPETVPTIRWRIAQAIGEDAGKTEFERIVEAINNDDTLRLDTDARNIFIQQARSDLFAKIGGDNDFYDAGFVSAFDKATAAWEHNWQRETASKHHEVMRNQWQRDVVDVFASQGPDGLLKLDAEWAATGGIDHETRNKLLIESVTQMAVDHDDPKLLDAIPTRFLNRESKIEISKAKTQIESARMSNLRNQVWMQEQAMKEALRNGKVGMLEMMARGEQFHPLDFRANPELFEYAQRLQSTDPVNPVASQARASVIRSEILKAATFGDYGRLGVTGDLFNEDGLRGVIENDVGMNPGEKVTLIKELPELFRGVSIMRDPDVRQQVGDRLNPLLQQMEASIPGSVNKVVGGKSLRAHGMDTFQTELHRRILAYYEDNNRFPTGFQRLDMIDAALERAEQTVLKLSDPRNLQHTLDTGRAPSNRATPESTQRYTPGAGHTVAGKITEPGQEPEPHKTVTPTPSGGVKDYSQPTRRRVKNE